MLYIKALHIIFVVTWFSGLFYLCRLFVYNREATDLSEPTRGILQGQYMIMIRRLLLGITWPSAILTMGFGLWLLSSYHNIPGWLWIKLGFVALLFSYHLSLHLIYIQQRDGVFRHSSNLLRFWNEMPTIFLVAIVMLVVVKQHISAVYGIVGLLGLVFALLGGIKLYRWWRENKTRNI